MKRVFAHIGFSFAITMIILNLLPIKGAFAVLALAGVLFVVFMCIKKTRTAVAVPLCAISCVIASVIFISFSYGTYLPQQNLVNKESEIEFHLIDVVEETDNGYFYTVKTNSIDINGAPQNIKLSVYSRNKISSDYNKVIKAKVNFSSVADNGFGSYGKYADNIFLSAYAYDIMETEDTVINPLSPVLKVKENVISYFLNNLEGDDAAIAIALVTGCRNYISNEMYELLKFCGIMHLFAVSGLHLSVFAGSLYFILKKLFMPKVPSVIITMMFVIMYMTFIGFTPSILRAGFMFLLLFSAKLVNKKDDTLNSLGLAVFLICLNPYAVTDVGGMLTVTSLLGLSAIYPAIRIKHKFKSDALKYVVNTIFATIAVLVTTLPVMYLFFGYQSFVCIILNIFMIPLVQFYLYLISFSLSVSFSPFISHLVFYPVKWLSALIIKIMYAFSNLYFLMLDLDSLLVGVIIGAVLVFFGISYITAKNKLKLTAILSSIIFVITFSLNIILSAGNTYVKIISGNQSSAVMVYDHDNAFVAGVSDFRQYYEIKNILDYKDLNLIMLIDNENSKYSSKIAEEFDAVNYIFSDENSNYLVNAKNVAEVSEFNVDLWHNFNVKYNCYDDYETVVINLYDFSLVYSNDLIDVSSYDKAVYFESNSGYDITYTVNNTGYIERRENNWLK